jgi:hypothetical protein
MMERIVSRLLFSVLVIWEILVQGLILNQRINPTAVPANYLAKQGSAAGPNKIYPGAYGLYEAERAVYEYLGLDWKKLLGQT